MEIKLEIQSGELVIVYKNNTSSVLRLWQPNNSWGWDNPSFILQVGNSGSQINITRAKTMGWTKNGPGYFEILPGQQLETSIQLMDKSWEAEQELSKLKNDTVLVKVVFRIMNSPEAKELNIWIGKTESEWLLSEPPHIWLFPAN